MAGHSKFKNIMHRKGRADAARSKLFSRLSREITVAAKSGLPDPAQITTARDLAVLAMALLADFPDRFALFSKRHVAFGMGEHICLGQFIARAQIQEGLHLIAQRIRNPRRVGPSAWRPFYGVWGLRGLPIEFDPAPALEPAE